MNLKIFTALICVLYMLPLHLKAQLERDTIITKSGDKIPCTLVYRNFKVAAYYQIDSGKVIPGTTQYEKISVIKIDQSLKPYKHHFHLGFGTGIEFSGPMGIGFMYTPIKPIGVIMSAGYVEAGFGYNAGLVYRLTSRKRETWVIPYFYGTYGCNTVIKLEHSQSLSKLYYGPTFGTGIEIYPLPGRHSHITIGLGVPIRDKEVDKYIQHLKDQYNKISFNKLNPVSLSVGYKFGF